MKRKRERKKSGMKAKKIVGAVIGAGVLLGMSAILAKSGSSASQPLTQAMHIPPARKTGLQWGYIRKGLHHTKDEKRMEQFLQSLSAVRVAEMPQETMPVEEDARVQLLLEEGGAVTVRIYSVHAEEISSLLLAVYHEGQTGSSFFGQVADTGSRAVLQALLQASPDSFQNLPGKGK